MGGDLNLKKSWHPHLRKNQERVWKEEKSALEERKQIEKLRKEREEERAVEELQKLQEAAGGKTVTRRVDWMYSGPGGDGTGVTEEREGYLLGKRRIDQLLKSNDTQDLQKGAAVGIDALSSANANTARDTQKKVLEDPLLMIQKQKMEMQLKAMKDAQKQAKYEEKRAKEKDRESRHRDRESRHRDHESRHRDRESRHRDRESRHTDRESRHRDHRSRRDRSRSRSPRDSDSHRRHHRRERSRSPFRRDRHQRRSRTPPRRHETTREPAREDTRQATREDTHQATREDTHQATREDTRQATREERLARMQADAASTEQSRANRVSAQEKQDAEEEKRVQDNLNTSKRLNASMGSANMGLGDAIARGRPRAEVDA